MQKPIGISSEGVKRPWVGNSIGMELPVISVTPLLVIRLCAMTHPKNINRGAFLT